MFALRNLLADPDIRSMVAFSGQGSVGPDVVDVVVGRNAKDGNAKYLHQHYPRLPEKGGFLLTE